MGDSIRERLETVQSAWHFMMPDHDSMANWRTCTNEACKQTRAVIDAAPQDVSALVDDAVEYAEVAEDYAPSLVYEVRPEDWLKRYAAFRQQQPTQETGRQSDEIAEADYSGSKFGFPR